MRKRTGALIGLGMAAVLIFSATGRFSAKADDTDNESLSACERYANQWLQSQTPGEELSLRLLPDQFLEEKYEAKAGRQFISTVLTGNGLFNEREQTNNKPFRFTCLLEDWRTPVFFHIVEEPTPEQSTPIHAAPDPAQQCWDQFHPAGWGEMTTCLRNALNLEQAKLKEAELATARRATHSMEQAAAEEALDVSSAFWLQYRDSECQRRQAQMAGANHPDVGELICRIQKTHQRVQDLQFDD